MTRWSKSELGKIAETDDLHISPLREGGATYGRPPGFGRSWSTGRSTCARTAALIATGKVEQLEFHIPNALGNGVTEEELIEVITHLAFYAGWPSAMSAVNRAKSLFAKQKAP